MLKNLTSVRTSFISQTAKNPNMVNSVIAAGQGCAAPNASGQSSRSAPIPQYTRASKTSTIRLLVAFTLKSTESKTSSVNSATEPRYSRDAPFRDEIESSLYELSYEK